MASKTKVKKKAKTNTVSSNPTLLTPSTDTSDGYTLEEELEWCIRELELGLLKPKGATQQKQEAQAIIKKLNSSKTPVPRKRQLMRATFGDYRSQMKAAASRGHKVLSGPPRIEKICDEQGHFYKQSTSKISSSDNEDCFKFNFVIEDTS